MNELNPLDGRYKKKTEVLRPFFSEEALIKARVEIEIRYFIALASESKVKELPSLKENQKKSLLKIIDSFDEKDAKEVKKIEATTNHDVKAVEYYIKKKFEKMPGLKKYIEFVHFGLTSEDVNNLAYGILIQRALKDAIRPALFSATKDLLAIARRNITVPMLSLTHGQPATPTTVGKEMLVFVERLERQAELLKKFAMEGKFGGAVGNFSAHRIAYPKVKWEEFGKKFVSSLGLVPLKHTTQINPHDDIAQLSHIFHRINSILIDLSRDMWLYISRGVFKQKVIAGEVGSSAMPHKVNPIDFENAEGNLGLSNALFSHFADKLPISRMQRDLSDSTVQRNIGVAFGYHLLAVKSLQKGLKKVSIDRKAIRQELNEHPEVMAEAIQTVLRKNGVEGAYEKLKELTRGEKITRVNLIEFIDGLKIPEKEKKMLMSVL